MKIAILLSGHLRSFRKTQSSFLQFKNSLEQFGTVDVFCHTWDIEESVTASWWKEHSLNDPPPATVRRLDIEDAYQPVKLIIEPTVHFDDSTYKIDVTIPVAGMLSMLYTQRRAFELLEQYERHNNFQYDMIIKTRFDLLYELAPEFNNCIKECIDLDCIYLPSSNPYELSGSSSDVFAIGSRKEMEKYFSFSNNFRQATEAYQKAGYRRLTPELCMTFYLQQAGVNRKELAGIRLHILRMNDEKFQINSDKNFSLNIPQCFFRQTIDANVQILPDEKDVISKNSVRLVKKYMRWINNKADHDTLEKYAEFYNGAWIGLSAVGYLAAKGKSNPIFAANVMRNFFENAFSHARYSSIRKFLLATTLLFKGGYGFLIIKVWLKGILKAKAATHFQITNKKITI